jgi:hypothetical protein
MWSALYDLMSSASTWLTVFKYMGLGLAAASSVWGTMNDLTTKSTHGRKQLTQAGRVAIGLVVLGLVISIISEDLQHRETAKGQAAEATRTNEIIQAGQPLTSLNLHWQITSASAELSEEINKGGNAIDENYRTSQGGSLETPAEIEEYEQTLLPLVSFIASLGTKRKPNVSSGKGIGLTKGSTVVLFPLDVSQSAILSFGKIDNEVHWSHDDSWDDGGDSISAGFVHSGNARRRYSYPSVTYEDYNSKTGVSTYAIDWDLNPTTLANVIDRRNVAITPTARLPQTLQIAIFYDARDLPFERSNFSDPVSEIWTGNSSGRAVVGPGPDLMEMKVIVETNGFQDVKRSYTFKRMYALDVVDEHNNVLDAKCTIIEFETEPMP